MRADEIRLELAHVAGVRLIHRTLGAVVPDDVVRALRLFTLSRDQDGHRVSQRRRRGLASVQIQHVRRKDAERPALAQHVASRVRAVVRQSFECEFSPRACVRPRRQRCRTRHRRGDVGRRSPTRSRGSRRGRRGRRRSTRPILTIVLAIDEPVTVAIDAIVVRGRMHGRRIPSPNEARPRRRRRFARPSSLERRAAADLRPSALAALPSRARQRFHIRSLRRARASDARVRADARRHSRRTARLKIALDTNRLLRHAASTPTSRARPRARSRGDDGARCDRSRARVSPRARRRVALCAPRDIAPARIRTQQRAR